MAKEFLGETALARLIELTKKEFDKYPKREEMEKFKTDTLGFYYSYIDLDNKKIYLSHNKVMPEIGNEDRTDTAFTTPEYPVGGRLCLVNGTKYDHGSLGLTATIKNVYHNVIEFDGEIGFAELSTSDEVTNQYTLFVIEAPNIGTVTVRQGAVSLSDHAVSLGNNSTAEGFSTLAVGNYSHAEGVDTAAYYSSHAEGRETEAIGHYSHSEGLKTKSLGEYSHSEGWLSIAEGKGSHVEGMRTKASGIGSHAEGYASSGKQNLASGEASHTEGYETTASGHSSHSEGNNTIASAYASHAEGYGTKAKGKYSHSEGAGTIATLESSHVDGQYNIEDIEKRYVHITGWGTSSKRKNIHTVDTNGNAWYRGDLYVGGNSQDDAKKVATKNEVVTLQKRVVNLENTVSPSLYSVDDSVAYEKYVPENALPNTLVKEIGGASLHEYASVLDLSYVREVYGDATMTVDALNNSITVTQTPNRFGGEEPDYFDELYITNYGMNIPLLAGKRYSARIESECVSGSTSCLVIKTNKREIGNHYSKIYTESFVASDGECITNLYVYERSESKMIHRVQVVQSDTEVSEWIPYNGKQLSETIPALVSELNIIGRNRITPNYPLLKVPTKVHGVDASPLPNGDIVLNGVATNNGNIFLFGNNIEAGGDERLYLESGDYHVVDTGNPDAYFLLKWQLSGGGGRGTLTLKDTDEYSNLGYTFNLRIKKGGSFDNVVLHPYILKGSDLPTELPEYSCTKFKIPQEVQSLPGYGRGDTDSYNRIEWDENGNSNYIAVIDDEGNKLETPLVVDTTEYFGNDNFIEVEEGGKITFVNDKQMAVPSTVLYQFKQT